MTFLERTEADFHHWAAFSQYAPQFPSAHEEHEALEIWQAAARFYGVSSVTNDEEDGGRPAALALVGWTIRVIDLPRSHRGDQVVRFHLVRGDQGKVVTIKFNETGWCLESEEAEML